MSDTLTNGVVFLRVNGAQYRITGSNFKVQALARDVQPVANGDGTVSYTSMTAIQSIECELRDTGDFSIQGLGALRDATVTAELNNGKVYILRNARYVGLPELNSMDGTIAAKFVGDLSEVTA